MDDYRGMQDNLRARISLWMIMSLLLGLSNIILVAACFYAMHVQKLVITTVSPAQNMVFQRGLAPSAYLSQLASYFATTLMTYTPESALWHLHSVLPLVNPLYYQSLEKNFKHQAQWVQQKKVSSVYYISQVEVHGLKVMIRGILHVMMAGEDIVDRSYPIEVDFNQDANGYLVSGFHQPVGGSS